MERTTIPSAPMRRMSAGTMSLTMEKVSLMWSSSLRAVYTYGTALWSAAGRRSNHSRIDAALVTGQSRNLAFNWYCSAWFRLLLQ
jgi:hypothetical protein